MSAFTDSPVMAQFRVAVSDTAGKAISSVVADETFLVSIYVADLRDAAQGVFSAYLDLLFDPARVEPAGEIVFGDVYHERHTKRWFEHPDILDEVGAVSKSMWPIGGGDFLVFSVPFRAESPGTVTFWRTRRICRYNPTLGCMAPTSPWTSVRFCSAR